MYCRAAFASVASPAASSAEAISYSSRVHTTWYPWSPALFALTLAPHGSVGAATNPPV